MEQDPGSALAQFVRASGPESLDDPRRVRAVLRDAAPSAHLEVSLLVAALEEGVGQRLARSSASLVGGEIDRLSAELVQRRGFAPDHADWAVRTVAWALGRAPQPVPRGGTVPGPGPGPWGAQGPRSEPQGSGGVWGPGPGPADWSWAPGGPVGGGPAGGGPVGGGPIGGGPVGGGPVGGGPVGGGPGDGRGGSDDKRRRTIVIAAAAAVAVVIVGVVLLVTGVFGGNTGTDDTADGGTSVAGDGRTTGEAEDTGSSTSDGSTGGDDDHGDTGHEDTSTTEPMDVETTYGTGSYPNAAETELLGHLSEDLTGTNSCSRWSAPDGDHVFAGTRPSAVISCHPPSGSPPAMTEIVFALYPTDSAAEDLFFATFHMPDIEDDQCVADWPMWDTYTVGEDTAEAGYLGCTVTEPDGPSFVVWTRSGTGVYAFAAGERTALHQLYGWWQKSDAAYIR